ncbi:MAG TPA: type II toxin-antitoxin system HipA family toxin YjjJ [Dokdonella sp.]
MSDDRLARLESLLRTRGAQPASVLAGELGISQPTLSRLLTRAGERVVRIGRARASRYALAHSIARAGSHWPLYRISADGKSETLGELHALHRDEFFFEPRGERPALMQGDFATGLFPGVPWFLGDQRPQGFLGRALARRIASDIDASIDPLVWRADDIVLALLRHGDDQPGDLVLGEASLQRALQNVLAPRAVLSFDARARRYPELADAALRGEDTGSAAGGEQAKFTVTLHGADGYEPAIVKFSERVGVPAGRRWADLLMCEHHAGNVLREHDLPAARSEILEADARIFLQSMRFDRTPVLGRGGFVSLAALDAAYYGHARIDWWRFAPQLERDGWLSTEDARRLRLFSWYGALIGNSDMHLGNAALQLRDLRPLPLAPAYDMLPMRFRPSNSGEIVERRYEIALPTPEHQSDWHAAACMAQVFWRRIAEEPRISSEFRAIADDAGSMLQRALAHLTG